MPAPTVYDHLLDRARKGSLPQSVILVHAMPVSASKIFLARWMESTVDSSWMVIVYSLPVFLS